MAMVSEETNSTCSHCNRSIPSLNMDLHYAHCSRNLEKCVVCGDMIPRKHSEEHYQSTHAPTSQNPMIKRDCFLKLRVVGFCTAWTLLIGCCAFGFLFPFFSVHEGHVGVRKPDLESKYSCGFMHFTSSAKILLSIKLICVDDLCCPPKFCGHSVAMWIWLKKIGEAVF